MDNRGKLGQNGGWSLWWYANRPAILGQSYRAPSSPSALLGDDEARDRARAALLRELRSDRELVGSEAALALGRLGDARDIATLSEIVADPEIGATPRTHRWAAVGLGLLPTGDGDQAARARDALLGALMRARGERDHFSFFWAHCAWALAMRGDGRAFPPLVQLRREALDAVNARTSLHADVLGPVCYALAVLGGDLSIPEVTEHLRGARAPDSGSKDTSWAACHALVRIGGRQAVRLLREAAADERYVVRRAAYTALGSVADAADDDTAALLRTAMEGGESDFIARQMAIVALGRSRHPTARGALIERWERCLSADRPFVAFALALHARDRRDPEIEVFLLRQLAAAQEEELKRALCLACGLARIDEARPRLVELVREGGPTVAAEACSALGLIGVAGREELSALLGALDTPGNHVVLREASLALGLLRVRAAALRLREVAGARKQPDRERAFALSCLGRIGTDEDIDFFVGLLEDQSLSSQLRACVIHGLGLLLDRSEGARLGAVAADGLWFWTYRGKMLEPLQDIQRLLY